MKSRKFSVETVHQPASLAKVLQVIADAGMAIEHLTTLRRDQGRTLWEITLEMGEEADRSLYERIGQLPTARFVGKSDRVSSPSWRQDPHRGEPADQTPGRCCACLTPGVGARVLAIQKDRRQRWISPRRRTVAMSPNGTAVLVWATSARSRDFRSWRGRRRCLRTWWDQRRADPHQRDAPARVADLVAGIETSSAHPAEDFAAPECFEIDGSAGGLQKPVLHDDQHGNRGGHPGRPHPTPRAARVLTCPTHRRADRPRPRAAASCALLRAFGVQRVLGHRPQSERRNAARRLGRRGRDGRVAWRARTSLTPRTGPSKALSSRSG